MLNSTKKQQNLAEMEEEEEVRMIPKPIQMEQKTRSNDFKSIKPINKPSNQATYSKHISDFEASKLVEGILQSKMGNLDLQN